MISVFITLFITSNTTFMICVPVYSQLVLNSCPWWTLYFFWMSAFQNTVLQSVYKIQIPYFAKSTFVVDQIENEDHWNVLFLFCKTYFKKDIILSKYVMVHEGDYSKKTHQCCRPLRHPHFTVVFEDSILSNKTPLRAFKNTHGLNIYVCVYISWKSFTSWGKKWNFILLPGEGWWVAGSREFYLKCVFYLENMRGKQDIFMVKNRLCRRSELSLRYDSWQRR